MEENTKVETSTEGAAKTYSEDEVHKLIQSESDKRVTQALETQRKNYEKKLSLSQLDGVEREKAEKDNRIAELEEQLKEFTLLQNKNDAIKALNERGLSPAFADVISIGEDTKAAQQTIEALDKLFKNAVAEEVKKRLSASTPKTAEQSCEMSKEQFHKLPWTKKQEILAKNPELYERFYGKQE